MIAMLYYMMEKSIKKCLEIPKKCIKVKISEKYQIGNKNVAIKEKEPNPCIYSLKKII